MTEKKVLQEIANDDWFHPDYKYDPEGDYPPLDRNGNNVYQNPLDSMPIATENPRPEEEAADIHQRMYELATKSMRGSWQGGSENLQ